MRPLIREKTLSFVIGFNLKRKARFGESWDFHSQAMAQAG